jgi:hypothetical protein
MEIRNSDKWSRAEFTRDFGRDQIDGLNDEVTVGQLASIRYELDSRASLRARRSDTRGRSSYRLTPDLKDCAHQLRLGGADAAHDLDNVHYIGSK